MWIKALKREKKNKTAWLPGYSDRVCSIHFIDGIPTAANPVPILHLGYEKEVRKSRRELFCQPLKRKEKQRKINKHQLTPQRIVQMTKLILIGVVKTLVVLLPPNIRIVNCKVPMLVWHVLIRAI